MKKWHLSVYLMLSMPWTSGLVPRFGKLLPGKIVINSVPEFLKQTFEQTQSPVPKPTKLLAALANASSEIGSLEADQVLSGSIELQDAKGAQNLTYDAGPDPSDRFPVQHAGLPQGLAANALPLKDSDHELMFNVSWTSPFGHPARSYSIEISNLTNSENCMHMCYAYDIPGEARWWLVPSFRNPAPETCAIRPGCSYRIRLIAHPWDGHTSANIDVSLDECESGVCSCDHAPRLPMPSVSATTVSVQGEIFANITWSLPPPSEPLRLPPNLNKQYYYVSIGKQMVSSAHPSPWFAHTISRKVNTGGLMAAGDELRWFLLPIVERDGRNDRQTKFVLDVKLLARVSVVDDRGCLGPAGNATAYDPTTTVRSPIRNYVIWAVFGGLCVLAMFAILAVSTRVAKRVLHALRPAPVSDPLDPLRRRPAWLPLPLRSNDGPRGQVEQSPLYVHKDYETDLTDSDEWEVHRSRVQLGALIGTGAFGRVHVAQLDMPGGESMTVAAKMLTENSSEEEIQDFLREIIMLKHVGAHKHVIRLIGCCTRRPPLIALLEHAPRGDLLTLLRKARGRRKENGSNVTRRVDSNVAQPSQEGSQYTNLSDGDPSLSGGKLISELEYQRSNDHYVAEPALHLDGSTMRDYALQVALGMSHLEDRGITHRDLAARNILVDGAGVLKVADFGLSRSGVYVHTRSRPVPLRWLAPEAILHAQYCSASDVWAFAVLLWEIATLGGFPYAELSNHQVPAYLASGNRLPKPERASPRLYQLMTECWSENPVDRPTFAQIIAKLTVQNLLYVDLECVLPPSEDDLSEMSDYFSMSEMKM